MKFVFASIAATGILATALTALPPSAAAAQEQRQRDNDDQRQRSPQTERPDYSQSQHPDYSRNKYYTLGNREGYQDYERKKERANHNHKYSNDEDRRAHDYGYQQGWHGQRGYQPESPDRR